MTNQKQIKSKRIIKKHLKVVFNFLFYLAFIRLFLYMGTERLNKKFMTIHVIFVSTIEKLLVMNCYQYYP